MRILVTGATGFIGRHLIERLVAAREHVKALVRSSADAAWLESLGVEVVRGNIGDAYAVERAPDKCGVIFHLGAENRVPTVLLCSSVTGRSTSRERGKNLVMFRGSTQRTRFIAWLSGFEGTVIFLGLAEEHARGKEGQL